MDAKRRHRARHLLSGAFALAANLALAPLSANATSFLLGCAQQAEAAQRAGTIAIRGEQGWWFLDAELRHLAAGPFWGDAAPAVSRATKPEYADPLPAIRDFAEQLRRLGIKLLIVPVPAKAAVYPEYLCPACEKSDEVGYADRAFVEVLRKEGISVVDLQPTFVKARNLPEGPLYCRQDSHWSGVGCVVAAEAVAEQMDETLQGNENFAAEWREIEITGDLWLAAQDPALPKERIQVRRVGKSLGGRLEPVAPREDSPIVLLGDSHNLVFHAGGDMFDRGSGFADQLAFLLKRPLDVVAVRGSGATPARINLFRRAQKYPDYWQSKKLVIWCFSTREFTQSDGWRKVPITERSP